MIPQLAAAARETASWRFAPDGIVSMRASKTGSESEESASRRLNCGTQAINGFGAFLQFVMGV